MRHMKLLRLPEVLSITGLKKTTHYRLIQEGLIPPPVMAGIRSVAWPESEIKAITEARIEGRTLGEIRELVVSLVEARKSQALIN